MALGASVVGSIEIERLNGKPIRTVRHGGHLTLLTGSYFPPQVIIVLPDQSQIFANRLPLCIGIQHEDAAFVENVNPRPAPIGSLGADSCIVRVEEPKNSETAVKLGFIQCLIAGNLF